MVTMYVHTSMDTEGWDAVASCVFETELACSHVRSLFLEEVEEVRGLCSILVLHACLLALPIQGSCCMFVQGPGMA
jgi:hypothetical protein